MTSMDIIKELTNELAIKHFYANLKEQQMQPEYSNLEFEKRIQLLLEAEIYERKNKRIISAIVTGKQIGRAHV